MKLNIRFTEGVTDAREFIMHYGEVENFNLSELLEGKNVKVAINYRGMQGGDIRTTKKISELETCYCLRCKRMFSGWVQATEFCNGCKDEMEFLGKMDVENEARRDHIANGGNAEDF